MGTLLLVLLYVQGTYTFAKEEIGMKLQVMFKVTSFLIFKCGRRA